MGKKYQEYVAVALIIISFAIYGTLPLITQSSLSVSTKTSLIIGVNIISWGMFFIGGSLGGKEVWHKYKQCLCKHRDK